MPATATTTPQQPFCSRRRPCPAGTSGTPPAQLLEPTRLPRPCRHRRASVQVAAAKGGPRGRLKHAGVGGAGRRLRAAPLLVAVDPSGADAWRLDPVVELLRGGGVGIIPTDSLPAVVCDLHSRDAALRLFDAMQLSPKKQLSILVRGFSDVATYTTGFPPATQPGQPDWFGVARRLLPGPYTFILPASKALPAQVVDFRSGRAARRKTIGVRMPDDPVCQALLDAFGGCLLSHSVHVPSLLGSLEEYDDDGDNDGDNDGDAAADHHNGIGSSSSSPPRVEAPDAGILFELYGNSGIDFVVDVGARVVEPTSVVDMTGGAPEIVRVGRGNVAPLLPPPPR